MKGRPATEPDGWTFECSVHFGHERKGRKRLREGKEPEIDPVEAGNVPRVARLLALAHRFQGLLDDGVVPDYAALARLAGVTRARVTQVMNLRLLAPDIQEAILFLPRTVRGRDVVTERETRAVVAETEWGRQRAAWRVLATSTERRD